MKMKGDKNSALNAADVPPDGQTESFNQPEKEETHNTRSAFSTHVQTHAKETVGATHTLKESVCFTPSLPLTPPPISSPNRLQASGCKQLQNTGVK